MARCLIYIKQHPGQQLYRLEDKLVIRDDSSYLIVDY